MDQGKAGSNGKEDGAMEDDDAMRAAGKEQQGADQPGKATGQAAGETQSYDTVSGGDKHSVEYDLKKLQDDLAEAKDKYLRLYSEFENFRRRNAKERLEVVQTANETLVLALLPISDDFERAVKALGKDDTRDLEGFTHIHNKFIKVLEQFGVTTMEVERGDPFNPDVHEAISQAPTPDDELRGKVIEVIEKGYLLNDKVIRFARVVVGG